MRGIGAALACVAALGGCSSGGDDHRDRPDRGARPSAPPAASKPKPGEPQEARAIRGWIAALNAGRFEDAASYFAKDAIVEQSQVIRLRNRVAAIAFNRSLPCRADVTDVNDEGRTVLAAFHLREGRDGQCKKGGSARVRFRIRDGKFLEWRQLPEPAGPQGQIS